MNTLISLSSSILLHIAFFCLILLPSMQLSAINDGNLIKQTCKNTPYFQVCYNSLSSDPHSSKADAPGLALIAVNKISENATSILHYIKAVYIETRDLAVKTALHGCNEVYNTVVNILIPEANEELTKGNYKFATDGITNTGREAQKCENYFEKPQKLNIK
ncbi:cell wall / vacuolar inhibitor of fructosidase 1 [Ziziphus jujuba]|uniref:Cell wall / vacuolar inhibitor of fructosidase 1 n=2 Tax=Ziziphus jujuba TaxID=326968 RepID=A0A6P3YVG0_ZIZJJ|nr:cell wall / vacuolar inhibitor of fructosidase 1 [Ziziphus jujuba]KAH7513500.1 hypothetical protein FEM48_Zijuj12G0206900 [Ziziphus jujuba var. spinosa]